MAAALRQQGVPCQVVEGALDVTQPVVKLATVHTAKGLEFEVVFICGLEAFKVNEPVELDAPEFQQLLDQERKLLPYWG